MTLLLSWLVLSLAVWLTAMVLATLGIAWILAFITRWIINAIILKLADAFTDRLTIDGFGWALAGALMMSAIGTLGEWVIRGGG